MEQSDTPTASGRPFFNHLLALFSGLALFQFFSSLSVFLTNRRLSETARQILEGGYLAVPGEKILPGLGSAGSAVCGGLFFTLTVGALTCLLAVGCSLLYQAFPAETRRRERRSVGAGLAALLLGITVLINRKGLIPMETLGLVLSACLVFFGSLILSRGVAPVQHPGRFVLHALPLAVLALLLVFAPQKKDNTLFTDFRDAFLMTNPLGMGINNFYYTHTLSPAEIIKSIEQKQIKTCCLALDPGDEPQRRPLEKALLARDYLILDRMEKPDLILRSQGGQLMFFRGDDRVMEARLIDFIADPSDLLKNFSDRTDTFSFYRKLIRTALLSGLPLLMYLLMYGCFYGLFLLAARPPKAAAAASAACFVIGLSFFSVLFIRSSEPVSTENLREVLKSPALDRRIAGLKHMEANSLDPLFFPSVLTSMESPSPLERYWAARASAKSKDPAVFKRLIHLTGDPHPNVACQAFYALGMGGNTEAVPEITGRIVESSHWYVQFYAYNALKRLGWTQARSDAKP